MRIQNFSLFPRSPKKTCNFRLLVQLHLENFIQNFTQFRFDQNTDGTLQLGLQNIK